ncbi:4'-phosphopantetheinyl transferase superfamily protein [Actinocatenispora rupis]|uniref:4'-phosphopantetheinyl transferase n=1 Tax=Actinocatenispora rupis TaxID=519421 RepID=A0A8J3J343_9ACTN|nr:4'-phosphopantetheinyl transferase [Actinocatenispora rupis]
MARVAAVEVWTADVSAAERAERLLSDAEVERAGRFRSEPARRLFVVSRAVQRVVGAARLGVPVGDVVIDRTCRLCADTGHGKPSYAGRPELDFSVSHSGTLVALALSAECRVGLDVEEADRRATTANLTDRVLTADERASGLPFLTLWTRKEATVKLTGHGLTVPFEALSCEGKAVRVLSPPDGWPSAPIHLTAVPVPVGYHATLATLAHPPTVTLHRAEPLLAAA